MLAKLWQLSPGWLQFHYMQLWPSSFSIIHWPLPYVISKLYPVLDHEAADLSNVNWCVIFFSQQLQHCLPVYLLLSRAHSQSSGGTQYREPPPASHHKLSRPTPPGCPGALIPWTEGRTQEPFWQGEAAPKSSIHPHFSLNNPFIPFMLLQNIDHLFFFEYITKHTLDWKAF